MSKRRASGDGMIRRRESGRWEGRIVVGHKENGDSIFHYVSGDSQKEMLEKLHRDMDAYRGADLTEDSRMTLAQWLECWLETYTTGTMRESTRRSYRTYVERYINPRLGDRVISGLTSSDIQKLYTDLLEHGRVHDHPQMGHRLSGTMVRRIHAMLHSALKAAAQAHLIARNPTEGAALPRMEDRTRRALTRAETERFLQTVREDPVWYPFFYTELTTGLRKGELCGLRWEDFDEEAGTLAVRRTLHTQAGGTLTTGETKTYAGTRIITLPASTAELLRERQKDACTPWIFPDPLGDGGPVRPGSASYHLKRLLKAAGLPDIRFHDLRHTFATQALASGVDAKTLSGILGHTNASFTLDTYAHVTGEMQHQAARVVGDYLTDVFGKELKPWQRAPSGAAAAST